jgi:hypothetical protein
VQRLNLFLFNDLLIIASKSIGINRYRWRATVSLRGLWLKDIPDDIFPGKYLRRI